MIGLGSAALLLGLSNDDVKQYIRQNFIDIK